MTATHHTKPADLPFTEANFNNYNPRLLCEGESDHQIWWCYYHFNANPEKWGHLGAGAYFPVVDDNFGEFKAMWDGANEDGKGLVRYVLTEAQKLDVLWEVIRIEGFEVVSRADDWSEIEEDEKE